MKQLRCKYILSILSFLCAASLFWSSAFPGFAAEESTSFLQGDDGQEAGGVRVSARIWELLFPADATDARPTQEERLLYPGGFVFGLQMEGIGVTVAEVTVEGSPLKAGDRILGVDGQTVDDVSGLLEAIRVADGDTVQLEVERDGKPISLAVKTEWEGDERRLGIVVRDGAAGIGTVTFIDPQTGAFGGLGHAICDPNTGEILPMRAGIVTEAVLGGVQRGAKGAPGELRGVLKPDAVGVLWKNDECGVFGRLNGDFSDLTAISVSTRDEVQEGAATVLSTVSGTKPRAYDVEISQIDYTSEGTKSFCVKVTDPALLAATGGIVRGMSGSPILQNGKLIGAVTHVMVADPTVGYGIFIENMLAALPEGTAETVRAA